MVEQIIVVDLRGNIHLKYKGYAESGFLGRAVLRQQDWKE
jgi:hypothetical protein